MTNNSNLEVSLVKYLCPICGKEAEEGIVMNSLLTEKNAKAVKELNGKTIGLADHCCKECAKYKDDGVFFIAIDESKSGKTFGEFYRTGQLTCIKSDADLVIWAKDFIKSLEDGTRFVFMDEKAGKEIGLW